MDGANRVEIINTGLVRPNALTLDYQEQVLYWGNGDSDDIFLSTIESSNVDGTNRRTIANDVLLDILSITVFADKLYFTTGLFLNDIYTTNKSGGAYVDILSQSLCGDVFGMEVVAASRQVNGEWHHNYIISSH